MPTRTEIQEFSDLIETIANDMRTTRMDAIVHHCEQTGIEIDVVSTLISSALKAKIREEAEFLNMMKKTTKLPI